MKLQAIIFDLDGVIADTAELHYLSWQEAASARGLRFDRAANERLRSLSRRASLEIIAEINGVQLSDAQMAEMMAHKNQVYLQSVEEMDASSLLPGVAPLIDEALAQGLMLAVGSASRNARPVLRQTGILERFAVVLDGNSGLPGKPAPDLFLAAAEAMNISPARCLVIEDAAVGIEAARAAGMWTLGVGPAARVGGAHIVLPSLGGVTLGWIEGRL